MYPTATNASWTGTTSERHWHHNDFANRPLPPLLNPGAHTQAPSMSDYLPPFSFPPGHASSFANEPSSSTGVYSPRPRIPRHPRSINERFSQPDLAQIPQSNSSSFFDAHAPRVVPRFGTLDHDIPHHTTPIPHRRPPHWEDNSFFLRNSWNGPLPPGPYPSGHECCSRLDHHHCGSASLGTAAAYANHWHHPQHVALQGEDPVQQHCIHRCCHPYPSNRLSTLTYVGPPAPFFCHNCAHKSPQADETSPHHQRVDTVEGKGGDREQTERSDKTRTKGSKKSLGTMRQWLNKYLSLLKPVTLKLLPKSSGNEQAGDVAVASPQSTEATKPNVKLKGARRVSFSTTQSAGSFERIPQTAGPSTSSAIIEALSSTADEYLASSSLPEAGLHVPATSVELISRPPSTISTCQCIPTTTDLHPVLRHSAFTEATIYWNITLSPTLIYEPDLKPDFLKDFATDPPIRHMFINGIGDFPLEKCQGDPDPARSKKKNHRQQHMFQSGNGDDDDDDTLIEKRTIPWPIRINGTGSNGFITLEDVFRAIHINFQQYIPHEEYDLYTINRKRLITAAYHLRQKALEETRSWPQVPMVGYVRPVFAEDLVEDGIMRCDYLGSQVMFRGLEVSADKEGYTLFLGPTN